MTREELKTQEVYYEMGFITSIELYHAYQEYLVTNNEDDKAKDILYEADELLRPLSRRIEQEIDNL